MDFLKYSSQVSEMLLIKYGACSTAGICGVREEHFGRRWNNTVVDAASARAAGSGVGEKTSGRALETAGCGCWETPWRKTVGAAGQRALHQPARMPQTPFGRPRSRASLPTTEFRVGRMPCRSPYAVLHYTVATAPMLRSYARYTQHPAPGCHLDFKTTKDLYLLSH